MVSLSTVHAHNATLKSLGPGLVAVFVGGTSGISLSTALSFARHTTAPRIYLIGRSQPAATSAIETIKTLNPEARATFLQSDISLLRNVDNVCEEIKKQEEKLNILFMTPGYMTLKGRDETLEGLDRKFVLHYYARMRFVQNLLPLLTAAAAAAAASSSPSAPDSGSTNRGQGAKLSRVISVLDPLVSIRGSILGLGKPMLDYDDLSLKRSFSLTKCGHHASLMNNFFLEGMAQINPGTSFLHAYPSGVDTGILRDVPGGRVSRAVLRAVLKPFMLGVEESGERHLFAATSARFSARNKNGDGDGDGNENGEGEVAIGSDGSQGSGCYWVSWDGEVFPEHAKISAKRGEAAVERIVEHTEEVFQQICEEGLTYP
ncbi:hypothetical protein BDW74DRAFT_186876 [Aspergillus multicolor]|uniref:uncharacterized protein n=1 Tax=Aspergillus multicolor TaxID=41759 RepID=UPI003CCDE7E8